MPSYAHDVKNELARKFDEDPECQRAELAAIFKVGSIISEDRMDFSTANAAVARKVITLLKRLYPDATKEVAAVRTKRLTRTMRYAVRLFLTGHTENFFSGLDSADIIRRTRYKISYLRGAFLAGGTVNRPEAQYYLEIMSLNKSASDFVRRIFAQLEFNTSARVRNNDFVVHMSEADSIWEFLGMVGAEEGVDRFESARNMKEVRANVNRITNCEIANLNKAIDAAQRQLADIRLVIKNNVKVSDELRQAMDIRLKYPECTVGQLAEKIFITRPGLMYRFKIIHKLAEKFR
ncbi:MAG: DNA-binding protein WhiA [Selenomonadaceae bacterium]|nr:DNA-binding protein WhiA [Selenomonadaceae bacterium]